MNALTTHLKQMSVVSTVFARVRRACDCAFFYWHRAVIPVYLKDVFKSGADGNGSADAYRMRYFFAALKDCLEPMAKVKHLEDHKMMRYVKCLTLHETTSFFKHFTIFSHLPKG